MHDVLCTNTKRNSPIDHVFKQIQGLRAVLCFLPFFRCRTGTCQAGGRGGIFPPSNFEMEKKWENRAQTKKKEKKKRRGKREAKPLTEYTGSNLSFLNAKVLTR